MGIAFLTAEDFKDKVSNLKGLDLTGYWRPSDVNEFRSVASHPESELHITDKAEYVMENGRVMAFALDEKNIFQRVNPEPRVVIHKETKPQESKKAA